MHDNVFAIGCISGWRPQWRHLQATQFSVVLRPFWLSISTVKVFQREYWNNLYDKLKSKRKNRNKRTLVSTVTLRRRLFFCRLWVSKVRLSSAFYRQNLVIFPLDLPLKSWYTKANPQSVTWCFPIDESNTGFSYISRWTRVEFACEIASSFFWLLFFKNKTGQWNKEEKGKKEVGVFMTGYLRPVTDLVSDPSHTD